LDILAVDQISKAYANHQALKEVSITIPKQSIFGLLGPNGAGKTTLLRIINQIINADSGTITIKGEPLNSRHVEIIGYLPEERGLYKKMKVGEHLLYFAQLKGLKKAEAIKRIKYWFGKFEIPDWLHKKVEDLSKGMQQKVQFIATVLHEPELIILDEPFSGFDPINANLIKDEILELRERGSTIIFSTHRMESVEELCDHIALINEAEKILDGSKKAIKNAYRSNSYRVKHKNELNNLAPGYKLRRSTPLDEGGFESVVQLENGDSPNQLISSLMGGTEIYAFEEVIPSVNDIFIQKVKEVNHG
jgi:ABC-2 type transport system ATP-binding protein